MRELLLGNAAFRKPYVARARAFLRELARAKPSPSTLCVGGAGHDAEQAASVGAGAFA